MHSKTGADPEGFPKLLMVTGRPYLRVIPTVILVSMGGPIVVSRVTGRPYLGIVSAVRSQYGQSSLVIQKGFAFAAFTAIGKEWAASSLILPSSLVRPMLIQRSAPDMPAMSTGSACRASHTCTARQKPFFNVTSSARGPILTPHMAPKS
ncbi:MAG: hypothetical protein FRX49_05426 [Trebouxia sp. A1-2]|nr:MAG: hypothetical protein FRX49_05426 [Trebouxia sp. A1-2]